MAIDIVQMLRTPTSTHTHKVITAGLLEQWNKKATNDMISKLETFLESPETQFNG